MNKFFLVISLLSSSFSVAAIRFELSVDIRNGESHRQIQHIQLIDNLNEVYMGKLEVEEGFINYTVSEIKYEKDHIIVKMEVVQKQEADGTVVNRTISKPFFIVRLGDKAWVKLGKRDKTGEILQELLIEAKAVRE